jgi:carbon monoxide dehydrogenase subunit G
MTRRFASLCLALSLCLLASSAAAADKVKGTVKEVDEKARTLTFAAEGAGKDEVLPVEKGVELKGVKPNAKVQLTIDGGVVKEIKAERARSAPGY